MKLITEQFQGQNVHHFVFEPALKEEKMHFLNHFFVIFISIKYFSKNEII